MSPVAAGIDIRILRLSQTDPADWTGSLDAAERRRADSFLKPQDRDRFRLGRGLLRDMLGARLGVPGSAVVLGREANGKPRLDIPCGDTAPNLAFNVSHSGDLVCVALGEAAAIGVDIERRRNDIDPSKLGAHVLTPRERQCLELSGDRCAAFFDAWVRKEALLKGIGIGLLADPRAVEILPSPDGLRLRSTITGRNDPTRGWRLAAIPVPEGYHGALAVLPAGSDAAVGTMVPKVSAPGDASSAL